MVDRVGSSSKFGSAIALSAALFVWGSSALAQSVNASDSARTTRSASASAATTPPVRAADAMRPLSAAQMMAPSDDLDAVEADIRSSWIQARLDAETPAAQRWYWIFLTLNAGAMAGQFALGAILPDTDDQGHVLPSNQRNRPGMYVGGVNAALGLLPMIILPFQPAFAAGQLRSMPARTPAERIARARRAEQILRDCSDGEAFGQSWISHALGVVVGGVSSIVLAAAFDQQWYWVLTNFATSILFNEIQVLTQPMQLVADYQTYQRDRWRSLADGRVVRRRSDVRVVPTLMPGGAGVVVVF